MQNWQGGRPERSGLLFNFSLKHPPAPGSSPADLQGARGSRWKRIGRNRNANRRIWFWLEPSRRVFVIGNYQPVCVGSHFLGVCLEYNNKKHSNTNGNFSCNAGVGVALWGSFCARTEQRGAGGMQRRGDGDGGSANEGRPRTTGAGARSWGLLYVLSMCCVALKERWHGHACRRERRGGER